MTALLCTLKKALNSWRSTVILSIKGVKSSKNMHRNSGNNFLPIALISKYWRDLTEFHKMMPKQSHHHPLAGFSSLAAKTMTLHIKQNEKSSSGSRDELVGQVGGTPTHATVVVMVRPPSSPGSSMILATVDPPSCC